MEGTLPGIHHVTAIAGDPRRNLDFYTAVLGLRLVKRTVNHDDPSTYHFYFGDREGRPGTLLTFFPWLDAPQGRPGAGMLTETAFSVPEGSLGYWADRLKSIGVPFNGPVSRFGEEILSFSDPDGLGLELVAHAGEPEGESWDRGPVPADSAVGGIRGVTLTEEGFEKTAGLLTETFRFRLAAEKGGRFRFAAGRGGAGGFVDVLCVPSGRPGRSAVGTAHHVAFRAPTGQAQSEMRNRLAALGHDVTPVIDRVYFRSVYFREPGGVLFEIATDSPGFSVDESPDRLGTGLMLPPWLESRRAGIEKVLPPLRAGVSRPA